MTRFNGLLLVSLSHNKSMLNGFLRFDCKIVEVHGYLF